MTNGNDLTGFNEVKPSAPITIDAHYSDNSSAAFAASDVSAQGNSGLNQEGSSASLPLSGPDFSDSLIGNN